MVSHQLFTSFSCFEQLFASFLHFEIVSVASDQHHYRDWQALKSNYFQLTVNPIINDQHLFFTFVKSTSDSALLPAHILA